ncbi:hypothetical protein SAMN05444748_102305 [Variovorax sp. OV700]|nr:hypothetical protein SAMN05444748_102305 [Variovorax sp. OV700]
MSAGLSPIGSAPIARILSPKSGDLMILTISAFSFATMSFGVPAGASTPTHVPMSKPLSPASSSGTSGSTAERLAVVTASARSLPPLMC